MLLSPVHVLFFILIILLQDVKGRVVAPRLLDKRFEPRQPVNGHLQIVLHPVHRILAYRGFLLRAVLHFAAEVKNTVNALVNVAALLRGVFGVLRAQFREALRVENSGLNRVSVRLLREVRDDGLQSLNHLFLIRHNDYLPLVDALFKKRDFKLPDIFPDVNL